MDGIDLFSLGVLGPSSFSRPNSSGEGTNLRSRWTLALRVLILIALVASISACGTRPSVPGSYPPRTSPTTGLSTRPLTGKSTGGPGVKICDQTLWSGPMTPPTYTLPVSQDRIPLPTLIAGQSQIPFILLTSSTCMVGSRVRISPSNGFQIASEAHARDGQVAAIALLPGRSPGKVTITVSSTGHRVQTVFLTVLPMSPGA